MKRIIPPITLIAFIALSMCNFNAEVENTIEVKEEFISETDKPIYSFNEYINQDNEEYKLSDVEYKLIDTIQIKENVKTEFNEIKNKLESKSIAKGQETEITVDNKKYKAVVVDVKYSEQNSGNRTCDVSGTNNYGLQIDKPDIEDTKLLEYTDNVTGKVYTVNAPLQRVETTQSEWQNYTYIDIVTSNYTDTQFMFNDKIITHTETEVLPSEYYDELLDMANMDKDKHRIGTVYWDGQPYISNGFLCRNARATIQAYANAYTAYYYQTIELDSIPLYTADITYEYNEEKVINTEYKYQAVGIYELQVKADTSTATQDEVSGTVKAVSTISSLLVLSLIFVIVTTFVRTKKSKLK